MQKVDLLEMHNHWFALLRGLGVDAVTAEADFWELVEQYEAGEAATTVARAYHNLTHIQQVLTSAEAVAAQAVDWTAVQLAIWFHDVVSCARRAGQ